MLRVLIIISDANIVNIFSICKRLCKYIFMIKDRVIQVIEFKGVKKEDFFPKIGMTSANFRGSAKNTPLNSNAIENILSIFKDINPEWLITGDGSMLRSDIKAKAIKSDIDTTGGYPLIDISVAAGFGSIKFNIEKRDVKDYYIIPKFRDLKIDFMIEVYGSSMYPRYMSGDIVACTIIRDSKFIQWNKVHIIATTEQGLLLKRIREHDATSLLAVSDNPEFPPFKIPLDEITGIALVVGIVRID